MRRDLPIEPPPTIAHLRSMGLRGFYVTCAQCQRSTPMTFEAVAIGDDVRFPEIGRLRRFACSACGARRVSLMPDWRDHRVTGVGR